MYKVAIFGLLMQGGCEQLKQNLWNPSVVSRGGSGQVRAQDCSLRRNSGEMDIVVLFLLVLWASKLLKPAPET